MHAGEKLTHIRGVGYALYGWIHVAGVTKVNAAKSSGSVSDVLLDLVFGWWPLSGLKAEHSV